MTALFLRRISMSDHGTFGVLVNEKGPLFCTLEPPDRSNIKNSSCIPEGSYVCNLINSPRYGKTFEITDVTGRTEIIFHWGNWKSDTKGCILLGLRFGALKGLPALISSKQAHRQFMELLEGNNRLALIIQNSYLYGAINRPLERSGEAPA